MDAEEDILRLLEATDPDFEQVMTCVFTIGRRETRTYVELLAQPGSTVEELASTLDRDRSNVNRSLVRLLDLDLVRRERRLLDPGGYVYQYTAAPLPETKRRLHEALDGWTERVHNQIDDFGAEAFDDGQDADDGEVEDDSTDGA